ncbi:hypothetical protein Scep_012328 [Stephania cephalantha]|uniref:Uncharacterized protein n=1 Tax=Stephania cephalantha TaxID=152367 RepID=A0AAP0JFS3_9MAGN
MSTSDGSKLLVWFNQAKCYFDLHEIHEISKLRDARICLMGSAQIWLQLEEKSKPFEG